MKRAKKGVYTPNDIRSRYPPLFFYFLFSIGMAADFLFNATLYGATFFKNDLFTS